MEAAERFEELKAQKEMRQLQEEKKNDKKPPPYKHIKVSPHLLCVFDYPKIFFLIGALHYL